jgi:FtsZ-binding cell division protein ZapB
VNPHEIAKDAIRIVTTAGLSKDVIDLLEKKVALLTDEISTLTRKLEVSESENVSLKRKAADLEQQLERVSPKANRLDEAQIKFLQLLFKQGDVSIAAIGRQLGISEGMADYHRGALMDLGMIEWVGVGMKSAWMEIDRPATFGISQKGRACLVENKLV